MPSLSEACRASALRAAERLGQEAGHAAGTWAADGNTSPEHARRVLAMLEEGSPESEAYLPAVPNLSGEWAGELTPATLLEACGVVWCSAELEEELTAALCEAWEEAASEAHAHECERTLRAVLGEELSA